MLKALTSKPATALANGFGILTALLAVLSWLTPDWFGTLSLPQALLVGMALAVSFLLALALIFVLTAWGYRMLKPVEVGNRPSALSAEQESTADRPASAGDMLTATATVSDVPEALQIARSLNVGQITIEAERLEADHVLQFVIVGFNGSNRLLAASRVRGAIYAFTLIGSGEERTELILPTPTFVTQHTDPASISEHSEFLLVLEQALRPAMVDTLVEGLAHGPVSFDFDALEIDLVDRGSGTTAQLNLWGGVTLQQTGNSSFTSGRIYKLQVDDAVSGGPTSFG